MSDLPEDTLRLRDFGFAPGGYSIICQTCEREREGCDKRALRCERCASALSLAWAQGYDRGNHAALASFTGAAVSEKEG